MKKLAPYVILFLFALLLWEISSDASQFMTVDLGGEHVGGPLGALLALLLAGGGVIIGGIAMLLVGVLLAVVFAGVGIMVLGALGVAAVALVLALSPLLLPLLLPLALIWFLLSRQRRARLVQPAA
ncbi:hypothetical protein [Massilia sp. H6]|uniref:hypothetical protein n=1 Tax=Massilia sp. H6 TaxID=2970464 RepID=UPI00216748C4|nr:hypothetical protein [Massilia sp. H6]UVW29236.1 hypothetical protein NRS07_03555 [Massilia sp. H6]